jgi:hypothetical protein
MNVKALGTIERVMVIAALAALVASTGYKLSAKDADRRGDRDDDGYTIALFGDMPYNALGKSQYPALLADINRAHVRSPCTTAI